MKRLAVLVPLSVLWASGLLVAQTSLSRPFALEALAQTQIETWTGPLHDAACKEATPAKACPVTATTTTYGVMHKGKFLKFDDAGNAMAFKKIQEVGAKMAHMTATVSGTLEGNTIQVQSLEIR